MSELKSYINRVLGNSLRCLLPSYWWKRLFGLLVDKVEEVDKSVGNKQEKLVSGKNIKTINGEDILGNGNIDIKGGSNVTVDAELDKTSVNPIANKAVANALEDKASKTYVTDEIGKIKIPDAVKVDTELSEESSNAIANSAVTAALDGKQDKEGVYEIDLGECVWWSDVTDRLETALIAYGKPQTGIVKVTGKIYSFLQNSDVFGSISFSGQCSANEFEWKDNGKLKGDVPDLTTEGGEVLKINLYVYEDYITITTKKGGTLYIGDEPANNINLGGYYNLFLVNEGSVAEEFNVSYNYSQIVQPISVYKRYNEIRVTVIYKGNVEEWLISTSLDIDENNVTTAHANPVKVSSIPVGGGEIDTSNLATKDELNDKQDKISDLADIRAGAALGATALQEHQDISHLATKGEVTDLANEIVANEEVHAAAYSDLNSRLAALEAALSSINQ